MGAIFSLIGIAIVAFPFIILIHSIVRIVGKLLAREKKWGFRFSLGEMLVGTLMFAPTMALIPVNLWLFGAVAVTHTLGMLIGKLLYDRDEAESPFQVYAYSSYVFQGSMISFGVVCGWALLIMTISFVFMLVESTLRR